MNNAGQDSSVSIGKLAAGRLIVFARYPEPGTTKTRLIPALGAEAAAKLQTAMTHHTLTATRDAARRLGCHVEVRFTGGDAERMRGLFGDRVAYRPQSEGDLGRRLEHAADEALAEGAKWVIIVGTDCPDLDASTISGAIDALGRSDVVLGPAADGGYYLIGFRQARPELFHGIDWGSERVLQQTLDRAAASQLKVTRLQTLPDVDNPEDLLTCRRHPAIVASVLPPLEPRRLSVVIPTLNEAQSIARVLLAVAGAENCELIIADGGSQDATIDIARSFEARIVRCQSGRGRQMNAGAAIASGGALLFLHADTLPPKNFRSIVWSTLDEGAAAGAFRLKIDSPRRAYRWVERGANFRSRLGMPYGDQGLFLRAELFYQLGGYQHWPLMEDYELIRRLRRYGGLKLTAESVKTSARRWEKLGVLRTTLTNQAIIAGYHLGVSPTRLTSWYRRSAKRHSQSVSQ